MRKTIFAGFTLIELLIVVLIIAILAAIAVPNFLEFQTRAKVARALSDMRSLSVAAMAYTVDNDIPPLGTQMYYSINGSFPAGLDLTLRAKLSSPIAYISNSFLIDPFAEKNPIATGVAAPESLYEYQSMSPKVKTPAEGGFLGLSDYFPLQRCYERGFSFYYGSYGPSHNRVAPSGPSTPFAQIGYFILGGTVEPFIYDPTNGTVSQGMILYTNTGVFDGSKYVPN